MFKGISTIKLVGILAGVLAVYFLIKYRGGSDRSESFLEVLVDLDTAAVTKIEIFGQEENVVLTKVGKSWSVGEKPGSVTTISSFMNTLNTIEPSRIASRKEASWKDFQVDSAGTRIKVYEAGDNVLDIIIGRFGAEGQRSYYSYVRLFEENDTYVADNFIGMSLGQKSADFRNGNFLKLVSDAISSVDFNYPDSAFSLQKSLGGAWVIAGEEADSVAVASYFGGLSDVNNRNFTEASGESTYEAIYHLTNGEDIVVTGFGDSILKSSQTEAEVFQDESLYDKIFKSRSSFID
jgi:flagellar biogenesis protein FliO